MIKLLKKCIMLYIVFTLLTGCSAENKLNTPEKIYNLSKNSSSTIEKTNPIVKGEMEQSPKSLTKDVTTAEHSEKSISGNSLGNILNWGFVAKDKDWIYGTIKGFNMSKVSIKGGKIYNLTKDLVMDVHVIGDFIYFRKCDALGYDGAPKAGYIYRIRKDGKDETKIINHPVKYFYINDSSIYFPLKEEKEYQIIKTDLNGNCETAIFTSPLMDIEWFVKDNNDIYYVSYSNKTSKLLRYSLITHKSIDLSKNFASKGISLIDEFIVDNDYIFFNDIKRNPYQYAGNLFKMDKHTFEIDVLSKDSIESFNIDKDWIYYSGYSDKDDIKSKIFKIKKDGAHKKKISNIDGYNLNIVGDWIYCNGGDRELNYYRIKTDGSSFEKVR